MPELQQPHRRPPLGSLSTKIIAFVFLSTFVTALGVSWVSIHSTHGYLHRQIEARFPALLEGAEAGLTAELESGHRHLRSRAEVGEAGALVSGDSPFRAVVRLDRRGRVLESAGEPLEWLAAMGGTPPKAEDPDIAVQSLRASEGPPFLITWWATRAGLWKAAYRSETITQALLADVDDLLDESLGLVDSQGGVIASTDPEAQPASSLPGERIDPGVHEYLGADRAHLLGSARPLAGVDAYLIVEEPFEQAFAPVLEVVTRIFVIDLCVILVFSFLAYRITSRIVKPIEALSEGARRISVGELDVAIPDSRSRDEIGLLTRTFNEMVRQQRESQIAVEQANRRLTEQYDELLSANEVLAQLSITDGLTKLHNHRYFQEHLAREIKRVGRSQDPLALLLMDLDDFKRLNDQFGHAAGDELLVRIAGIMSETIRDSDVLARYGGEEFVVLAPATDLEGAIALAEKIRIQISERPYILDDSLRPVRVTLSVGVAMFDGDRRNFFQQADRALYRAKAQGKNCVVAFEPEDQPR